MNEKLNENNKLPLALKFMKIIKEDSSSVITSKTTVMLSSEKYQTNFLARKKPYKPITRLL